MSVMAPADSWRISDHYKSCVETFRLFLNALENAERRFKEQMPALEVQPELGRFRVWGGNLAAHQTGRSSLDHRLRYAERMRKRTISLLGDLCKTLNDGVSILNKERLPYDEQSAESDSSDSSSGDDSLNSKTELEQILSDIKNIITYLFELAIIVRDPTPIDRFKKAERNENENKSAYTSWDIQHVRDKFDSSKKDRLLERESPFLVRRLGKANTRRRQLFDYYEKHNSKLRHGVDAFTPLIEPEVVNADDFRTDPDRSLSIKTYAKGIPDEDEIIQRAPSTIAPTLGTQTTVATFLDSNVEADLDDNDADDGLSETSSAASEGQTDEGGLEIPEAPAGALENKAFECPYCYEIIRAPSTTKWRKHFIQDLQPYICTFEDCIHPNKTYGSRHEWFNHEAQNHRIQWTCPECQESFSSKFEFVKHRRRRHPLSFADQQLPALLDMCSRPADKRSFGECGLCFEPGQLLYKHVAHHLKAVALFAVPRKDDGNYEDGESDKVEAGASEEEKGRATTWDSDEMSDISDDVWKPLEDTTAESGEPKFEASMQSDNHQNVIYDELIPEDQALEFWDRAYQISNRQDPWSDYEKILVQQLEGNVWSARTAMEDSLQREELMSTLFLKKTEILEDPEWASTIRFSLKAHRVVKIVLFVRDSMSTGDKGGPHAALAWAGVCLLLPALQNPLVDVKGKEDFFDSAGVETALDYLSALINRLNIIQQIYLESKIDSALSKPSFDPSLDGSFGTQMISLCSMILTCQSQAIYQHLGKRIPADKSPLPSLILNLKKAEAACREIFNLINPERLKVTLDQRGLRMDELLRLQKVKWQNQEKAADKAPEDPSQGKHLERIFLDECLDALCTSAFEDGKSQTTDRAPGTCQWFLEHPIYKQWLGSESSSVLWLAAGPGFGKSVLLKSLIDGELESSAASATTCYFFFRDDSTENRSATKCLSALLYQLCSQNHRLLERANDAFRLNGRKMTQSFPWLWELLISLAKSPEAGIILCLLDALDKCEEVGRERLITSLKLLQPDMGEPKSKIMFLVTSRSSPGIDKHFNSNIIWLFGDDVQEAMNLETRHVILDRVSQLAAKLALDHEIQTMLQSRLLEMQNRTHLWLHLTLAVIEEASGMRGPKGMAHFVNQLPKDLEEAYGALLRLSPQPQQASKLLHIVVAAVRPLTLREMNMALSLQEGQKSREEVGLHPEEGFARYIENLCGSIVNVYQGRIFLIHQTAKEWWTTRNIDPRHLLPMSSREGASPLNPAFSHRILARICLIYIAFDVFEQHPPPTNPAEEDLRKSFGLDYKARKDQIMQYAQNHDFLEYAATHWPRHFELTGINDHELLRRWKWVCQPLSWQFYSWFRIHWYGNHMRNNLEAQNKIPKFSTLALACFLGHFLVVQNLVKMGEDLECKTRNECSPLIVAIDRRATAIVAFLVQSGASTTSEVIQDVIPMGLAAYRGFGDIVECLIEHGANVEQKTRLRGITALGRAAQAGHTAVVESLLRWGADVNTQYNDGKTALMVAAKEGHKQVAEVLINKGADVNACTDLGWTALLCAISEGHDSLAQMLLNFGANTDVEDEDARSPLSWAAEAGLGVVASSLIEEGASVDSEDDNDLTPLLYAVRAGHGVVAQELLKGGADVNISDRQGQTALSHAVQRNNQTMTKLLLDGKSDPEVADERGLTPLLHALSEGHTAIIQLLLNAGADPNNPDADGQSPLKIALNGLSGKDTAANVALLCKAGADVDAVDEQGRTALSYAVEKSDDRVAKALLDSGANPDIVDNKHKAPLHYAIPKGDLPTQALIMARADVNIRDAEGKTPLDLAMERNDAKLISFLKGPLQGDE